MHRRPDTRKLINNCSSRLASIRQVIVDAADSINDDQIAWGQFLDYEHSTGQTGVYGTASAVKTLSLLGESDASEYIKHGLNWLIDSYENQQSIANKKMDWGVVYKHCYFLESIEPAEAEINADSPFAKYFKALVDRKLPGDGWGEFYNSAENKDLDGSIIATAISLYVLRRYISFSRTQQGKDAALWFCQKLSALQSVSILELALSIIALQASSLEHRDLSEHVTPLVEKLERNVIKLSRVTSLPEYQHHFTVPNEEVEKSRNRYIFLPINAIVSYSLLISDKYKTTKDFIDRTVAMYQESILLNQGYLNQEEAPRKSTINQFWVVLLLKEYSKITPLGKMKSAFFKLKSKPRIYYATLSLISIIIFVITYFLLKHFEQNPNLSFVSLIVLFVVDRVLSFIWKSNR